MASTIIKCLGCGTRNRVTDDVSGKPRCSNCHSDLPWLANVSAGDFQSVISRSSLPALVDLWAPWCGPCKAVAPALEQLSRDMAGSLRVVKVNVDEAPDVSARLGVQGIPTMVLFADGKEIDRTVGAMPGDGIRRWVDSALSAHGHAT